MKPSVGEPTDGCAFALTNAAALGMEWTSGPHVILLGRISGLTTSAGVKKMMTVSVKMPVIIFYLYCTFFSSSIFLGWFNRKIQPAISSPGHSVLYGLFAFLCGQPLSVTSWVTGLWSSIFAISLLISLSQILWDYFKEPSFHQNSLGTSLHQRTDCLFLSSCHLFI